MFDVLISIVDNKVLGKFVADSYFFEPSKYDYAFYLYKNNEKIDTRWYSNSMDVYFDLEDTKGIFHIKAFVRDLEHKNKRTFDSGKITIDN